MREFARANAEPQRVQLAHQRHGCRPYDRRSAQGVALQ